MGVSAFLSPVGATVPLGAGTTPSGVVAVVGAGLGVDGWVEGGGVWGGSVSVTDRLWLAAKERLSEVKKKMAAQMLVTRCRKVTPPPPPKALWAPPLPSAPMPP